jgi:hypothetical protein
MQRPFLLVIGVTLFGVTYAQTATAAESGPQAAVAPPAETEDRMPGHPRRVAKVAAGE